MNQFLKFVTVRWFQYTSEVWMLSQRFVGTDNKIRTVKILKKRKKLHNVKSGDNVENGIFLASWYIKYWSVLLLVLCIVICAAIQSLDNNIQGNTFMCWFVFWQLEVFNVFSKPYSVFNFSTYLVRNSNNNFPYR